MYENMVRAFMERHGQFGATRPTLDIPPGTKLLRARLVAEEAAELAIAIHEEDLERVADAVADLLYVAVGTGLAFGIPVDLVFAEVHRSNMSKDLGVHHNGQKSNPAYKVGKGKDYSPPNLRPLLGLKEVSLEDKRP